LYDVLTFAMSHSMFQHHKVNRNKNKKVNEKHEQEYLLMYIGNILELMIVVTI